MTTRDPKPGEITEAGEYVGPTLEQGPITPIEEAGYGEILAGQLTFDDWLDHVPREIRARAYDSIAVSLVSEPTRVEDYMVEILGEGYFRDPGVFEGDALWINQSESPFFRGKRGWDERFKVWMSVTDLSIDPDKALIDVFIDYVAEGDPALGIIGDPTLKGFVRGGSGWETFKYPLAYADRKDFLPFLQTVPVFSAGTGLVAAGIKGTLALKAGSGAVPGAGKLTKAMLGASEPAQFLRLVGSVLLKPVSGLINLFQKMGNVRGVRPTALAFGGTMFAGGLFTVFDGLSDARNIQEIQTATISSFQEALTEQDFDEAEVIYEIALAQGLDMSEAGIDVDTGQQFLYETESGQETAITVTGPNGEDVVFGEGAEKPTALGNIITLPGHLAATFGKGGIIGTKTLSFVEGYDSLGLPGPAPLLGAQGEVPLIDETYRALRWYPITEQEEADRQTVLGLGIDAPFREYRTEEILPIFRSNDFTKYLNSLSPIQLVGTQGAMMKAGYLNPGVTINGVNFQPGLIDANTRRAMREVMIDANINGYQNVNAYLRVAGATGKPHEPSRGSGGFRRAPFERRAYLAPDYDTLTQYVKGVAGQQIGRKLNDAEMVLMADKMGEDHRANFDIEETARRAQYDAAGRGGDPGFIGEMVDMEASFKEFFEEKYETEIERRDTVEDVYNSTQNFFGSLDNAARLIGR